MSDLKTNAFLLFTGLAVLEAALSPNNTIMGLSLTATAILSGLIYFFCQGWTTSLGNEWLLIIQNGELKKAGVGLKTFKFWNQVAVKFPSTINGVRFEASQVTSENFGIQIKGVVYWAVYRQGDGPFKCYKYIQGTNANENVKQMTESIVRSQISNTKLLEVLKNRHGLREAVTNNLRQSLEGWGIWAETVEITEVIISSNQTFKDMQTEFRFNYKQVAQKAKQETESKLEAQRQKFGLSKQTILYDMDTKMIEKQQEENLKQEEIEKNLEKVRHELNKEDLLRNQAYKKFKQENEHARDVKKQEYKDQIEKLVLDNKLKQENLDRQVENTMNQQNKELMALKKTGEIYQSLNHDGLEIQLYSGAQEIGSLAQVLPGLNLMNQVIQQSSSNK